MSWREKHGTNHLYCDGCRCDLCRSAHNKAMKRYRFRARTANDGTVTRPLTVAGSVVREHCAALIASGWTWHMMARDLGLSRQAVWETANRRKRVTLPTAARILTLQPLQPVPVDDVVVERLHNGHDWRTIGATIEERHAAYDRNPTNATAARLGLNVTRQRRSAA